MKKKDQVTAAEEQKEAVQVKGKNAVQERHRGRSAGTVWTIRRICFR